MSDNAVLFLVFVVIFILYLWIKEWQSKPQYMTIPLFTPAEKNFMWVLDRALGGEYMVLGKVRIADVLRSQHGIDPKKAKRQFWQTSSKHLDFVIADKKTLDPVCVIELNDGSHERKDRKQRDIFVDEACRSAELPILWVKAERYYDEDKVRAVILNKIREGREC